MAELLFRGGVAALVVIGVTLLADKNPRLGALLLTLPIVSIVAFVSSWQKTGDLVAIGRLARETLVLVPLGLPFFVPIAFARSWGIGFWPAFGLGLVLATVMIGLWFRFGPG